METLLTVPFFQKERKIKANSHKKSKRKAIAKVESSDKDCLALDFNGTRKTLEDDCC